MLVLNRKSVARSRIGQGKSYFELPLSLFLDPLTVFLHPSITPPASSSPHPTVHYDEAEAEPLAPFGTPVWKPLLNLRGISFMERIRPEPVVFLRLAFMPQLTIASQKSVICLTHESKKSRRRGSLRAGRD